MSRDNWARLVTAVVRRQQLWELCHAHSRSPSICSLASDDEIEDISTKENRVESFPEKGKAGTSSSERRVGGLGRLQWGNFVRKKGKARTADGDHPRAGMVPRAAEAEQVAAGWPSWLAADAGEAIKGLVPRSADSYDKLAKIGQGTFSNVYLARDTIEGKLVALKKVRFDSSEPASVCFMAREILILRWLNHPNVMKLEGVVPTRMSYSLYLVFEYIEHDLSGLASLSELKFTEPQIKCYMNQLLEGLDHCHSRGVLHRDLKGSDLLIDNNGVLKIADFGLASFYDPHQKHQLTSRVGTLWYRPPELILGATHYSASVDLWSTGCILAELYAGKPIMTGETEVHQLVQIFKLCGTPSDEYRRKSKLPCAAMIKALRPYRRQISETFNNFPAPALSLIETLLSIDPIDRGSAASALKSEFFTTWPHPCDPSSLPKYPSKYNFDAQGDKEARRLRIHRRRNALENRGLGESHVIPTPDANAELISSLQLGEGPM